MVLLVFQRRKQPGLRATDQRKGKTDLNNAKQNGTYISVFASSTIDALLMYFLSSPTTDANRRESGSRGRWVLGTRRGGALGGGRRWRRGGEVGAEVTGGEETRRGASSMDAEAQARRPPPPLEAPSGGGQMRI